MYQWFACFSWCILTKHRYYLPNTRTTTLKDIVFRATFSCIFSQFFLLFTPKCDTCDSKKTTLRLECAHLCAPMRIYACTRETLPENSPSTFFLIFSSSSFFSSGVSNTCKFLFCYMRITDLKVSKEKSAHFLDFFTLWGNIDPYTNRGMNCKPPSVQELVTCIEH